MCYGRREKQDVGYQTITASQPIVYSLKYSILFLTSSYEFEGFVPKIRHLISDTLPNNDWRRKSQLRCVCKITTFWRRKRMKTTKQSKSCVYATFYPPPSTFHPPPSTLHLPPSTFYLPPSTFHPLPSTFYSLAGILIVIVVPAPIWLFNPSSQPCSSHMLFT
jgi:hypothetical protein